jgi:hypothetical protein
MIVGMGQVRYITGGLLLLWATGMMLDISSPFSDLLAGVIYGAVAIYFFVGLVADGRFRRRPPDAP